jgi:glycosyltransferase involved in cell wall biosynthesis
LKIIQLITGAADIGGAQTHVRDLAAGLRARGHDCIVLTGPPDGLFSDQLRARGIRVKLLPALQRAPGPTKDMRALVELVWTLHQLKPDLIAAHTAKAGFLGRVAGAILNIPCVFTPHGWSVIDRSTGRVKQVFRVLERLAGVLGQAAITVCQDEYELGRAKGLISPRKLYCVQNGIPDSKLIAAPDKGDLTIVMVARFHKQKDHVTLLRAFSHLQKYPWRLQLIGSGPLLQQTKELSRSLGLEGRIEFPGECRNTDELLSQASVFVLSTLYEAFPISILEAMRAGLPVVASNVGGISEAVIDGRTGFLVPPSQPDMMAKSLELLFLDPALRVRLGRNGREVFLSRFTDERMILRTLNVYDAILHNARLPEESAATQSTLPPRSIDADV